MFIGGRSLPYSSKNMLNFQMDRYELLCCAAVSERASLPWLVPFPLVYFTSLYGNSFWGPFNESISHSSGPHLTSPHLTSRVRSRSRPTKLTRYYEKQSGAWTLGSEACILCTPNLLFSDGWEEGRDFVGQYKLIVDDDEESRSWHVSTFHMTWDKHGVAWLPSSVKLEFHLNIHSMV
jgi:hypothetical protein